MSNRWPVRAKRVFYICLGIVLAAVAWEAVMIGCLFLTDSTYEAMLVGPHSVRSEIESALPGFKKRVITDKAEMSPLIVGTVEPGMEYARYTGYCGLEIDVVYDSDRVVAIWPEYE